VAIDRLEATHDLRALVARPPRAGAVPDELLALPLVAVPADVTVDERGEFSNDAQPSRRREQYLARKRPW
jgi:hypothetical protein